MEGDVVGGKETVGGEQMPLLQETERARSKAGTVGWTRGHRTDVRNWSRVGWGWEMQGSKLDCYGSNEKFLAAYFQFLYLPQHGLALSYRPTWSSTGLEFGWAENTDLDVITRGSS